MVRIAFFVVGPASSGTRLVTRLLIDQGVFGDAGHEQRLDAGFMDCTAERAVLRRSIPHGADDSPPIEKIASAMVADGYWPHFIVTVRDMYATARSQVRNGYSFAPNIERALEGVCRAYKRIFSSIAATDGITVVPYEAVVLHPVRYCEQLFKQIGIVKPKPVLPGTITNQNHKYYI